MTIIPEDLIIHKANKQLLEKMNHNEIKEEILFETESVFHNISVVKSKIGHFLKYNDTYQAGFIDTKDYKGNLPYINYFLIPYLINKNIKNILFVGFGSGIILKQYESIFSKLKKIDVVDIEENILEIAQNYFNFQKSEKINFHLQDALIFLKQAKKKYDLIVVDVAGNEGIDERFCDDEYLNLIKSKLNKKGIFVSNYPSSRDIFNKKNKFVLNLLNEYKKHFNDILIFNGETSNKIFYKTFFNIDEIVLDVTNLILISSNEKIYINKQLISEFKKINVDIEKYLNDLIPCLW